MYLDMHHTDATTAQRGRKMTIYLTPGKTRPAFFTEPKPGDTLANGARVIAFRFAPTGDPIVFADNGREYITWLMNPYEGFTVCGHYFEYHQFAAASADFLSR
jgi:hypothetical protein